MDKCIFEFKFKDVKSKKENSFYGIRYFKKGK
jgi:hypothetical protein